MQQTANHLRETIEQVLPILKEISEIEASHKADITKWSKKEVIGHLIDSACNNQQKFVKTMAQQHLDFSIDNSAPFTLEFIMKDYAEHLKHHLKQILPEVAFLKSSFTNVYR